MSKIQRHETKYVQQIDSNTPFRFQVDFLFLAWAYYAAYDLWSRVKDLALPRERIQAYCS